MATIPTPKMSHEEANRILTAPGSPLETEEVLVKHSGIRVKQFKHAPKYV
jgi:hypothetical protein